MIDLADFMLENAENNILPMSGTKLRRSMKYNIYLYNETSGRLKALEFHSGPSSFTKTELLEKGYSKYNSIYCFRLKPEFHPNVIENELYIQRLKDRRKKLDCKNNLEKASIFLMIENIDKFKD